LLKGELFNSIAKVFITNANIQNGGSKAEIVMNGIFLRIIAGNGI